MYSWDFVFDIPHDIAPYARCRYGRLYYRTEAKLTLNAGGGILGAGRKILTAHKVRYHTRPSCLIWKEGVDTDHGHTYEQNTFPIALPTHDGALAYCFNHQANTDLGPLLITARSHHLTTGGYLRFALLMPCLPSHIQLVRVTAKLHQRVTLHSRKRPGFKEICPLESHTLVDSDCSDLQMESVDDEPLPSHPDSNDPDRLRQRRDPTSSAPDTTSTTNGDETGSAGLNCVQGEWVSKLPIDDFIRPTSLRGSQSAINVAHQMVCQVRYTLPSIESPIAITPRSSKPHSEPQLKQPVHVYQATWDIDLPSCAAKYDSVRLPSYSALDSEPVPPQGRDDWIGPNEHESHSHCACGQPLEELIEIERRVGRESALSLTDALRADLDAMRYRSRSRSATPGPNQDRSRSRARSRLPRPSRPTQLSHSSQAGQEEEGSRHRSQSRGRTGGPHVPSFQATHRSVDVRAGLLHSGMFGPYSDEEELGTTEEEGYVSPYLEEEDELRWSSKQSQLYEILPPEQRR